MAWHIVIAGGGFGGFYAARSLERHLPPQSARVTLINDANFMLYTPLLPGAAGATLDPRHVVVPLRKELRRTDLVIGKVTGADPAKHTIRYRGLESDEREMAYDRLIVAMGSVSRTLPIPGLAEHGIGFKSIAEAIELRNRVLRCMDVAEQTEDPQRRAEHLSFVCVGAGYAGLEGLAELQDFAAAAIQLYPRNRTHGMRWTLVEARERIMLEVPESLATFTAGELRARGIDIRTGTTVEAITERTVTLSDGETIPSRTVVWTAGVKPSPVVAKLGLPLDDGGRIRVQPNLKVEGHPDVYAIGDAAAVPDPAARRQRPSPPTAQHAIRQGRLAARNVAASLRGGRERPFRYRTKGVVAELGHNKAVAITVGIRWRGLPAWFIARTYHLLLMPGLGRKLRLLADWNVALVFGRDTSELGELGHPPPLGDPGQPSERDGHAGAPRS